MECSEDDIYTIAGYGFEWRRVGRRLIGEQKVKDIDNERVSEGDKREMALLEWKRQGATFQKLVKVLRDLGDNATANRVEELMKKSRLQGPDVIDGPDKPSKPLPKDERSPTFEKWGPLDSPKLVGKDDKEWKEVKEYINEVKILIQSCNINEYNASLELLKPIATLNAVVKFNAEEDAFPIVLGNFADRKCALALTKQGQECRKGITISLNCLPKVEAIIGIGIAFGISKDRLKYGDVLIGKQITDYGNAKIEEHQITPRLEVRDVQSKLYNIFCLTQPDEWKFHDSKAYTGNIASKFDLINDRTYIQKLKAHNHIGGEMEGGCLLSICKEEQYAKTHFIIIKGVSDFGDGDKDDRWQITAAKAAADYVQYCLSNSTALM